MWGGPRTACFISLPRYWGACQSLSDPVQGILPGNQAHGAAAGGVLAVGASCGFAPLAPQEFLEWTRTLVAT